jgi:hypothetical protein
VKKNVFIPFVFGVVVLIVAGEFGRAQTPILYYNFEQNPLGVLANNATIDNVVGTDGIYHTGTAGGSGTIFNGGIVTGGNLGRSLTLTPFDNANDNLLAPNIDTGFTATQLSIGTASAYTAMAWVNFANQIGDNMVFGQVQTTPGTTPVLHLGSRNAQYWDGHWADDINSGATSTAPNTWHHVAWTNTAAGTQTIFVDGLQVATGPGDNAGGPTVGQMVNTLNVAIGTSGNGGSFSGSVDELKVYNQVLTQAQIQAASVVIPEPGSAALLAVSALALALRRRQKID